MSKSLELAEHKRIWLEDAGFKQTYFSEEATEYQGAFSKMEKWEQCGDPVNIHFLYIHFQSNKANYCELYCGKNYSDSFSERNLISELKKREIGLSIMIK